MLAIEISQPGNCDVLLPTSRAIPEPLPGQVLIKVVASGVNRPDVMQRKGLYPSPPGASDIPGLEIAGTIVALGKQVQHWQLNDTVCALVSGGGYAEYCLASAASCLPIPPGISVIEAAALPETFFTVWHNVFERGQLKAGETFLVHGGTSGIGTVAIQLAKAFGAGVITTVGSTEKRNFCQQLGADLVINYTEQDFVETILEFTNKQGVDLILDMIGGDYFPRNLKCLGYDGRLVEIALMHGSKTELDLLPVMLKRLTLTGSTLRVRSDEIKAQIAQNLLDKVWPLFSTGQLKPIIHSIFPLADAPKAHALMESSQHIGKIILKV